MVLLLLIVVAPDNTRVDRGDAGIAVLSIGYRPLGSRPRAAGWSAADVRSCTGFWTPAAPRLSACTASRRPKSVEARSRGKVGGRLGGERYEARYEVLDLGDSKSGGLETRGRIKQCGAIFANRGFDFVGACNFK